MMASVGENARAMIKKACNADESDVCLFTGSGATAAIQKLVDMLEVGPATCISDNMSNNV